MFWLLAKRLQKYFQSMVQSFIAKFNRIDFVKN